MRKRMKKLLCLLLAISMVVPAVPAKAADNDSLIQVQSEAPLAVSEASEAEDVTETANLEGTVISMDLSEKERKMPYMGVPVFEDLTVLRDYVKVSVDGSDVVAFEEDLTLEWMVMGADGKLTPLLGKAEGDNPDVSGSETLVPIEPKDAGTYYLSVTLKAREGVYQEAGIDGGVVFTIEPTKIHIVPEVTNVKAGMTAGDVKVADAVVSAYPAEQGFIYVADDQDTADVNEAEASDFTITASVRDAMDVNNTALAADTVLVSNKDYVVDFTVTFTEAGKKKAGNNYVLAPVKSMDLVMSDLIPAYVNVTPAESWKEEAIMKYPYTGGAVAAPVKGTDYTVNVQYENGIDEEGNVIFTDISDAELTEEWYVLKGSNEYVDSSGHNAVEWEWVKLESAPTEAGSYVYRLSYEGKEGIYAPAYTDIQVVIEPMEVVIVPVLKSGAVFYDEMTEEDILASLDYKIYAADDAGHTKELSLDRDTVWGTSYYSAGSTQPYEPTFILQYEKEDENVSGNSVFVDNKGALLDSTKNYRVIFSGLKSVVSDEGIISVTLPINAVVNTTSMNYNAETSYEVLSANALAPVNVLPGKEVTVDVGVITAALGNKGDSLENIYSKVYDGIPLYPDKASYKKAVVTAEGSQLAKDTAAELEYRWYKNTCDSITDYTFSDATDEPYTEGEKNIFHDSWKLYGYNGHDIPVNGGIYKLEITYKDLKKPEYRTGKATVYYVIEKQPVRAALAGEYTALVGQKISSFLSEMKKNQADNVVLEELKNNVWAAMDESKLKSGNTKFWSITYEVIETPLAEKLDESGAVVTDENGKVVYEGLKTEEVTHSCDILFDTFDALTADGSVQKQNAEKTYTSNNFYYDVFKENAEYKVVAKLNILNYSSSIPIYQNYTSEYYVINEYTIKTDEASEPEVHKVRETKSYCEAVPVSMEAMGTTELNISVSENLLGNDTKVYDGETFDLEQFLGEAVTLTKTNEDGSTSRVEDVELAYTYKGALYIEDSDNDPANDYVNAMNMREAIDAGTYQIYADYQGSTEYRAFTNPEYIADITITPAKITITPVISGDIEAGTDPQSVWNNGDFQKNILIEGVADRDKNAFSYLREYSSYYYYRGFEAFTENYQDFNYGSYDNIIFDIFDEEGESASVLRGDRSYTIQCIDEDIRNPYLNNYEFTYEEVTFTPVRAVSRLSRYSMSGNELITEYVTNRVIDTGEVSAEIIVTTKDYTHTVVPAHAIPYSYYMEAGEKVCGNFLAVVIDIPKEYQGVIPETAKYENEIAAAGGRVKVLQDTHYDSYQDEYYYGSERLLVMFDAADLDTKTFKIRWEDGYYETFVFDFTNADLMEDLSQAVAPKSMKFNGAAAKMAVGEMQELDLKITKVQKNDVIYIDYTSSDDTILSVDAFGKVTALKKGQASITATPVKNVNGEKVSIEGAKAATVKITVKDVTAPKIKKLIINDELIVVPYGELKDGYRREAYILKGKNLKPQAFEEKIAQMTNGYWEGLFDAAPVFISEIEEQNNENPYSIRIEGLESNTAYTVYVRNVSGVRKADNGNNVTFSAAGVTKSFTTLKKQADDIRHYAGETVYGRPYAGSAVYVRISDGKYNVKSEAGYESRLTDPSSEVGEITWEKLPLSASLKKMFESPKLSYDVYANEVGFGEDEKGIETKLASIDKKGVLKLSGAGVVYVKVEDSLDLNENNYYTLPVYITAEADKVKGGRKKIAAGATIHLAELLTYYDGKKKLIGNFEQDILIDDALIESFENSDAFKLDPETRTVTAIKENGKLSFTLTDSLVKQRGGQASANVTLTSTKMEAVKNVKTANTANLNMDTAAVADSYAVIQFTHSGNAKHFKIEVKDQRNRIIRSSYIPVTAFYNGTRSDVDYVEGKDEKMYYTYRIPNLSPQSKYQVFVTARYDELAAKTITGKITTPKIPASTYRVRDNWETGKKDINVGNSIYVTTGGRQYLVANGYLSNGGILTSGNTYPITLDIDKRAKAAGSDSLIWTSSNKKVAQVTPNSGTFYASFKALSPGTTIIEVKSNITKEIIARYEVYVYSIGDAYGFGRRYFEDNLPPYINVKEYIGSVELNGTMKYVTVPKGQEVWMSYTAPRKGVYTFQSYDYYSDITMSLYNALQKEPVASSEGDLLSRVVLDEKQTVYIKLSNESRWYESHNVGLIASVNYMTELEMGRELVIPAATRTAYVSFTAKEDGVYSLKENSGSYLTVVENIEDLYRGGTSPSMGEIMVSMKKGQTYCIQVRRTNQLDACLTISKFQPEQLTGTTAQQITAKMGEAAWVVFTAPENNVYTFTAKGNQPDTGSYDNYVAFYENIPQIERNLSVGAAEESYERSMKAGDKLYIKVYGRNNYVKPDVTLSVSKLVNLSLDKTEDVKMDTGIQQVSCLFTAPEAGYYAFNTGWAGIEADARFRLSLKEMEQQNTLVSKDVYGVSSIEILRFLDAGETVYVVPERYDTEQEANMTLTVKKAVLDSVEAGKEFSITLEADERKYYTFTAPEEGLYEIKANDVAWGNITATTESDFQIGTLYDTLQYPLTKGESILLDVMGNGNGEYVFTVAKSQAVVTMTADQATALMENTTWFVFTAPEDDIYKFTSVFDAEADIEGSFNAEYYEKAEDEAGYRKNYYYYDHDDPFEKDVYMEKGDTVYWKAGAYYYDEEQKGSVSFQVEQYNMDVERLSLNVAKNVSCTDEKGYQWLVFTAPTAGSYRFYSESPDQDDIVCELYRNPTDISYLYRDDDSNGSLQFRITYSMEAGETIYLKAGGYDWSSADFIVYAVEI